MSERDWEDMTQLLLELEQELRSLGLWACESPPPEQLNSSLPFAADRLAFEAWLQWIFLPRMNELVARRQRLPAGAGILAMGEHSLAHLGRRQFSLLQILGRIDQVSVKLV